ncbi:MAG: hypothetical protein LBQ73_11270 [Tannerellaceae bacterium]|jgi:hypothetical protein|nr:hypothetical protein [Tannerellaceae bacterium]
MESIVAYILEHPTPLGIMLLAVIATAFATVKIYKYKMKIDAMKEKIDVLPCAARERDHINIASNQTEMLGAIRDVREILLSREKKIEEVMTWVMKKDRSMIDVLMRHSPLSMTPVGRSLFEQTPSKQLVDNNNEYLLSELEKENPLTAFDVEDMAFKIMLRNINHPMYNDLKQFLYNAPEQIPVTSPQTGEEKKIAFDMNVAMQLMAIYLRDLYLDIHPDIK